MKASSMTDDADKKRSLSFSSVELLLVSRAFMKVRNNEKHGIDRNADKFWYDIHLHYNELIGTPNKINEANIKYTQMEHRDAESLCNCWQRRLAPAIQKFARIVSQNQPLSLHGSGRQPHGSIHPTYVGNLCKRITHLQEECP
jgi:hypothetical protein